MYVVQSLLIFDILVSDNTVFVASTCTAMQVHVYVCQWLLVWKSFDLWEGFVVCD